MEDDNGSNFLVVIFRHCFLLVKAYYKISVRCSASAGPQTKTRARIIAPITTALNLSFKLKPKKVKGNSQRQRERDRARALRSAQRRHFRTGWEWSGSAWAYSADARHKQVAAAGSRCLRARRLRRWTGAVTASGRCDCSVVSFVRLKEEQMWSTRKSEQSEWGTGANQRCCCRQSLVAMEQVVEVRGTALELRFSWYCQAMTSFDDLSTLNKDIITFY